MTSSARRLRIGPPVSDASAVASGSARVWRSAADAASPSRGEVPQSGARAHRPRRHAGCASSPRRPVPSADADRTRAPDGGRGRPGRRRLAADPPARARSPRRAASTACGSTTTSSSAWPGEEEGGIHEAWTLLSALAAVTERAALGTIVLGTGFRPPALTAKMAATLDEIADGRLILGLGTGWHEPEYRRLRLPVRPPGGPVRGGARGSSSRCSAASASRFEGTLARRRRRRPDPAAAPPGPRPGPHADPRRGEGRARPAPDGALGGRLEHGLVRVPGRAVRAAPGRPRRRLRGRGPRPGHARGHGRASRSTPRRAAADPAPPLPPADADTIARALDAWRDLGVGHVQVDLRPADERTIDVLLDGPRQHRGEADMTSRRRGRCPSTSPPTAPGGTWRRRTTSAPGERAWALAAGRGDLGHLRHPGDGAPHAPRRPRGPRRDRARLRHRLRLGLDGPARRARPVGIDNSAKQLETAARLQREHGLDFPLAPRQRGERPLPRRLVRLRDQRVRRGRCGRIPQAWVPEAARLLRPGGRLHVLTNSLLDLPHGPRTPTRTAPLDGAPRAPRVREARAAGPTSPTSWSSTSRTASGSASSATQGFEMRGAPRAADPGGRHHHLRVGARTTGRARWPCEEVWKVRKRG